MSASSFGDRDGFDAARAVARGRKAGKTLINHQIEQRSTQLGEQVSDTAQVIRDVGSELEKRGRGTYVANAANAVATYIDRIGAYLEKADATALGSDFETLARRQPGLVGALAFAGGFVASRILRVSTTSRS